MTTPALLNQLKQYVSAEAYRQLAPDDLWLRFRDALDETAFRVLLERFGPRVFARCRAIVRDEHLAEEAFQDTFRDLIRKRDRIPTYPKASAWAYQAATNHAKHLRRKQRRWWFGDPPEPTTLAASPDDAEVVGRLLAGLPDRYRRPLELVYWDGLTHAEAAAVLGWSKGTVDSYVARGLKRLKAAAGKAGFAAAVVGTEAALARPAAALSEVVLANVLNRVWPEGGPVMIAGPWWATGWTKAAVALAAFGTAAAAGVWWGMADRPSEPLREPPVTLAVPVETLQAKNLRIATAEVIGPVRDIVQSFYKDNPIQIAGVRTYGSEVEVEFRSTLPPPTADMAARMRMRYCTLRRRLAVSSQPAREDQWYSMDPNRPLIVTIPMPFGSGVQIVRGREQYVVTEKLFNRLPLDERSEAELVHFLFGEPGGELLLPMPVRGVSSFPGGLAMVFTNEAVLVRDDTGRWRYAGECPSWLPPVVADGRVYCRLDCIRTRQLFAPHAAWERFCDPPPVGPGESVHAMFIAADRLYMAVHPHKLFSRPHSDPTAGWVQSVGPPVPHGLTGVGETLFGNDGRQLLVRPAANLTAPWTPVGPWPAGCIELVADGNRLLAFEPNKGPIYARSVSAKPDEPWQVVGGFRDPYGR